ncbi:anti-sigma factor [Alteromonas sp. CI.11.F.A3]|uniref:anti-sigma factor n=1 Tax=Alteromonas sp. CI.11.F.A3 TaxID=3079555 RepID=UPI0029432B2A|nr:anti-sigma factor [Alteromonas sp. CI.11.F.A3]WOI38330.1 anti-sigma factor [Alteromonas sp. CI.11.F.A3]
MNYLKEERLNALAAEYVVGTLRGKARLRYQKLLMQYQIVGETTAKWEEYLAGFSDGITPVEPPHAVWEQIQRRLDHGNSTKPASNVLEFEQAKQARWRYFSFLSTAAAMIFAVLLVVMMPVADEEISHVAVVNNADNAPLWVIEVSESTMDVKVTSAFAAITDKDYELWMVPENGEAPISLGLLPESGFEHFATNAILLDGSIAALAVSLEAPGGSKTGAPTEVLYIAPLVSV